MLSTGPFCQAEAYQMGTQNILERPDCNAVEVHEATCLHCWNKIWFICTALVTTKNSENLDKRVPNGNPEEAVFDSATLNVKLNHIYYYFRSTGSCHKNDLQATRSQGWWQQEWIQGGNGDIQQDCQQHSYISKKRDSKKWVSKPAAFHLEQHSTAPGNKEKRQFL